MQIWFQFLFLFRFVFLDAARKHAWTLFYFVRSGVKYLAGEWRLSGSPNPIGACPNAFTQTKLITRRLS